MSERDCGCATRTVPCACGGSLTATPARGIEATVREHVNSLEHQRWRAAGGLEPLPEVVTDRQALAWLVQREQLAGWAA